MNLFSAASFILLSSTASSASGSNIHRDEIENEHGEQQSLRNLALRSGEVTSQNNGQDLERDEIDDIFEEIDDGMYDILADSYNQLTNEINSALLVANPDLEEEGLVYAREAFMEFLKEDNDVPDADDTGEEEDEDEDEGEGEGEDVTAFGAVADGLGGGAGASVGSDLMDEVWEEPNDNGGMQRGRSYGRTTYRKYEHKGCRNSHRGKGSSHHEYNLYYHFSSSSCKSKCNSLGRDCYGYEYHSDDKKCEVWKVPVKHVQYVHGLDCYIKN